MTPVSQQTAVVEHDGGAWMVLHANGDVRGYATALAAFRAVAARAHRANVAVTLTRVEWRNVPDGFVPPQK